jgi:hypothetical protein
MNEDQKTSLTALLAVECNMAEDGETSCDGKWCNARKAVAEAFGLAETETEEEDSSDG